MITKKWNKPMGHKTYGSIPHLSGSRRGSGDHKCHIGQEKIATKAVRDKNDEVFVQEKLDGSNVGIYRDIDKIIPLGRAGYPAVSSPYEQHRHFHNWVFHVGCYDIFMGILQPGERLVGEWLMQAHGTKYEFEHYPFVPFDLMKGHERLPYDDLIYRLDGCAFTMPHLLHRGGPLSVKEALKRLGEYGHHGAVDKAEGCVWRVERDRPTGVKGQKRRFVDFLVKYVRPDKVDGKYFPEISGKAEVWNWRPDEYKTEEEAYVIMGDVRADDL